MVQNLICASKRGLDRILKEGWTEFRSSRAHTDTTQRLKDITSCRFAPNTVRPNVNMTCLPKIMTHDFLLFPSFLSGGTFVCLDFTVCFQQDSLIAT